MHGGANGTMHQATRDKLSIAHTGKVTSEATREKMRMSNIGKTRSKQTKARIAAARTGTKHTEETLKKMSETQKNRAPITEETRKKLSQANKGKKLSENHKSKIAKTLLGNTNGAGRLGTKHSEESKRRISESQIGRVQPKLKCPHCKKVGGQSAMKQWHFDNCKLA